jgi:hypothetical protein
VFAYLFDFLQDWQHWLSWIIRSIWRMTTIVIKNGWGIMLVLAGWVWTAVEWMSAIVADLAARADMLVFPQASTTSIGPITQTLAISNTFLPTVEQFVFLTAFLGIMAGLTLYKLIKSWIPGGFG